MRLFRAISVVDNFQGKDGVVFDWYCSHREQPVAPYEELLVGFYPSESMKYIQEGINEYFTEQETKELAVFLRKLKQTQNIDFTRFYVKEMKVPMEIQDLQSERFIDCFTSVYSLHEVEGYNLSIPVEAYYDLRECPATLYLSNEQMEAGVNFLGLVLDKLSLPRDGCSKGFSEVLKEIYDEHGFFVEKGQTRHQRLMRRDYEIYQRTLEEWLRSDRWVRMG